VNLRTSASTLGLAALLLAQNEASGETYPSKPIRVLTTEPSGFLDVVARLISHEIAASLGQAVIVENRPSTIQPELIARAMPDGYSLGVASGTTWLTPLMQKTSYDAVRDFSPVTLAVTYPNVLVVHPSVAANSVRELIAYAKARPGTLNIAAAASPGGQSFLAAELFKTMAGVRMVRVPYKGNEAAVASVTAGETQVMFTVPASAMRHAKVGSVKALAVTSLEPSPLAAGLPTMAASGLPGYESRVVVGILAPARTPPTIINRLNQETSRVLNRAEMKEKVFNLGADAAPSSPAQFAAKIKSEIVKWGKVLKDAGVTIEL
jgi:tripartite-type tricarboxylate transporter receptor subunit TctC